jgi:hypothetical protein
LPKRLCANRPSLSIPKKCDLGGRSEILDLYKKLPSAIQERARNAFASFRDDPGHSSLRFKKLQGFDRYWSVRIDGDYRAVGERHGEVIDWFWIGDHGEFDRIFGG